MADLEIKKEAPCSRPATTPAEINEKNRRFWNKRNRRFHRLLAIPGLAEEVVAELVRERSSNESRGVYLSFRQERPLEEVIDEAARRGSHIANATGASSFQSFQRGEGKLENPICCNDLYIPSSRNGRT